MVFLLFDPLIPYGHIDESAWAVFTCRHSDRPQGRTLELNFCKENTPSLMVFNYY